MFIWEYEFKLNPLIKTTCWWRIADRNNLDLSTFLRQRAVKTNNGRQRFDKLLKGQIFSSLTYSPSHLKAFVRVPYVPVVLSESHLFSLWGPSAGQPVPLHSKCICSHSRDAAQSLHRAAAANELRNKIKWKLLVFAYMLIWLYFIKSCFFKTSAASVISIIWITCMEGTVMCFSLAAVSFYQTDLRVWKREKGKQKTKYEN